MIAASWAIEKGLAMKWTAPPSTQPIKKSLADVARREDEHQVRESRPREIEELLSPHFGHGDVAEHHVDGSTFAIQNIEGDPTVLGFQHGVSEGFEHPFLNLADPSLILNHENRLAAPGGLVLGFQFGFFE